MAFTSGYDLAADAFESQLPSCILEHQSKYTTSQLDIQDQANCSMLGPINDKNNSPFRKYQAHLMNQGKKITDIIAQYEKSVEDADGRQMSVVESLHSAEQNQQRHNQLFGNGANCPLCLNKKGESELYKSEHAFNFHLRQRHRPRCPNCRICLAKWSDYTSHLPYCAHKGAGRGRSFACET